MTPICSSNFVVCPANLLLLTVIIDSDIPVVFYIMRLLYYIYTFQFTGGFVSFMYPEISVQYKEAVAPYHVFFGVFSFILAVMTAVLGFSEKLIFALYVYVNVNAKSISSWRFFFFFLVIKNTNSIRRKDGMVISWVYYSLFTVDWLYIWWPNRNTRDAQN